MGVSGGTAVKEAVPGAADHTSATHEFAAIVGAPTARVGIPACSAPASTASRAPRRTGSRTRAVVVFGVLSAAGVALAASIIVAVEVSQNPVAQSTRVLSGEKLAAAAKTASGSPRVPFGGTTALGSDLAISVSDPIAYTPSPEAVGTGDGVGVVSSVTVTNLGPGPVQPRLDLTLEDTSGTRIFDDTGGIRLGGTRTLQPGESATYRAAFAVANVRDMALRVSTGNDAVVIG